MNRTIQPECKNCNFVMIPKIWDKQYQYKCQFKNKKVDKSAVHHWPRQVNKLTTTNDLNSKNPQNFNFNDASNFCSIKGSCLCCLKQKRRSYLIYKPFYGILTRRRIAQKPTHCNCWKGILLNNMFFCLNAVYSKL